MEQLIQTDPEMNKLAEELRGQKELLSKLPKFQLSDDFADRLISDSRVGEAFVGLQKVSTVSISKDAGQSSQRVWLSASAIASLAAMVLAALFFQNPVGESLDSGIAKLDAPAVEKAAGGQSGMSSVASKATVAAEEFEPEELHLGMELGKELEVDAIARANGKGGGIVRSKPGAPELIQPRARQSASINVMSESVVVPSNELPAAQKDERQQRWAQSMQRMDMENGVANDMSIEPAQSIAAAKILDESNVAKDPRFELEDKKAIPVNSEPIGAVVEVELASTGQKLVDELSLALARNSIATEPSFGTVNQFGVAVNTAGGGRAGRGGGGGFGGGGGIPSPQFESASEDLSSFAVLVTTTPEQMAELVMDLKQQNASVGTYELPQEQFKELGSNKQFNLNEAQDLYDLGRKTARLSKQEIAEFEKKKGADAKPSQRNLSQSYRGFAQTIRKNDSPDWSRALKLKEDTRASKKIASRVSKDKAKADTGLEETDSDFEAQSESEADGVLLDDAESLARYYLLLVRGRTGEPNVLGEEVKDAESEVDDGKSQPSKK